MQVLIFGKAGQVARALALADRPDGWSVTILGRADCDLAAPGAAADAIRSYRPGIVINTAAYTAVDKAESERDAARTLNAVAPGEMARAAADVGAPLIHMSTDYVYEGRGARPHLETDPHCPINFYGATKAEGDEAIRRHQPQHIILRTSWVFSPFGANFVRTMLRLGEAQGEVRIVGDQIGGPTAAADIAQIILRIAAGLPDGGAHFGTYHYAGAPDVSWHYFAGAIFEGARRRGLPVPSWVHEIASADYKTSAERPMNSRLDCSAILRDWGIPRPSWQRALEACLDVLAQPVAVVDRERSMAR